MRKDYRSVTIGSHISNTVKPLVLTLSPVTPVQPHGAILQVFNYKRIKTENLDLEEIKRIYELQNAKDINVLESPAFFMIQYPGRPVIYLNKKNGRLYSLRGDGFPQKEHEFQASFVVRMFHKWGHVEGLHSKRIGGKFINKERQETEKLISAKNNVKAGEKQYV